MKKEKVGYKKKDFLKNYELFWKLKTIFCLLSKSLMPLWAVSSLKFPPITSKHFKIYFMLYIAVRELHETPDPLTPEPHLHMQWHFFTYKFVNLSQTLMHDLKYLLEFPEGKQIIAHQTSAKNDANQ